MADSSSGGSKFSLGLVLGVVGGALAAFFLTPTTGEENRKKAAEAYKKVKKTIEQGEVEDWAKEIFGEVTDEGKRLLTETQKELATRMHDLRDQFDTFDQATFAKFIDESVAAVGERVQAGSQYIDKVKASLLSKWETEDKKTEKAKKVLKPKIKAEKVEASDV